MSGEEWSPLDEPMPAPIVSPQHQISKGIGIDMGHRVTWHGSKCRSVHGHRYSIQAFCTGPLCKGGEQDGMVIDFGFLKEEMLKEIDVPCDHALCLWYKDPLVGGGMFYDSMHPSVVRQVEHDGYKVTEWEGGKLYLIDCVPTAENLAQHWFNRLALRVHARTDGKALLSRIRVWETPSCFADFPGP